MLDRPTLATRLLGYILLGVGSTFKRPPVRHLGHYLTCRGTPRKLSELHERALSKEVVRLGLGRYCRRKDTSSFWHVAGDDISEPATKSLHATVGKLLIRKTPQGFAYLDRYMFYPNCAHQESHGPNCDCDCTREWSTCRVQTGKTLCKKLPLEPPGKKKYIKKRASKERAFKHNERVILSIHLEAYMFIEYQQFKCHFAIKILFDDSMWEKIGRPFYTKGHIALASTKENRS